MSINFPGSIDTTATLLNPFNKHKWTSRLKTLIAEAETILTLTDLSDIPADVANNYIGIDDEIMFVVSIDNTGSDKKITVARGQGNSTAAPHSAGVEVLQVYTAEYHKKLVEAVIAVEEYTKSGDILLDNLTQITTRNHNDLQSLNATSAHPSASIDNTSTAYGRGLATTDNTVQKVADRVNANGTPQFVTDKSKCSLLLNFKNGLADSVNGIVPIGYNSANKWTDNYVNDSTSKEVATNISCTLKQFEGDEGLFGSGVAVEESRTNLLFSSENLSHSSYWGFNNCTVTYSYTTNDGIKVYKITSSAAGEFGVYQFKGAGTYIMSGYLHNPLNLNYVKITIYDFANFVENSGNSKLTYYKATSGIITSQGRNFGFRATATAAGQYFYAARPQLEAGSFPTSYIATGATAVTRPAGKMNFDPKLIGKIGSISSWQKYEELGQAWQLITPFQATDGTNLFDIFGASSPYTFRIGGGTNDTLNYSFAINTWYHLVLAWDNTNIKVYINGVLVKTATQGTAFGTFTSFQLAPNNNIHSNFTIFNYALSADEISNIYNAGLEGKPIVTTNPLIIIPVGQSLYDTLFTTFASGWGISSTYPNKPTMSNHDNIALLRGIVEYSGVINSDVTLFTLPVGSRPSLPDTYFNSFIVSSRDSGAPSVRILRVYGNGDVKLMAQGATITNPAISLDGINFVNGK